MHCIILYCLFDSQTLSTITDKYGLKHYSFKGTVCGAAALFGCCKKVFNRLLIMVESFPSGPQRASHKL